MPICGYLNVQSAGMATKRWSKTRCNPARRDGPTVNSFRQGKAPSEASKMPQRTRQSPDVHDLDTKAVAALEEARDMPPGPERTEAMKKAGILRNAADIQGLFFAKRGRPAK
jgi:hypothetical protein